MGKCTRSSDRVSNYRLLYLFGVLTLWDTAGPPRLEICQEHHAVGRVDGDSVRTSLREIQSERVSTLLILAAAFDTLVPGVDAL